MLELWCVCICDWGLFWVYWLHNSQIMRNCWWSLNHCSVQKSAHGDTSVCVKNISNLSAWRIFRKSIFSFSVRTFPEDNAFDCFHTHTHARTQDICVSACMLSSFPHGLSNRRHFDGGDSTIINVLLSIFQPLCSSASVSISTVAHLSINERQIRGELSFNLLTFISFTWINSKYTIHIGTYAYRSAPICFPICRKK